jgi:hypothetical protein
MFTKILLFDGEAFAFYIILSLMQSNLIKQKMEIYLNIFTNLVGTFFFMLPKCLNSVNAGFVETAEGVG